MNYEDYLKSPDIQQAFNNMFEKQRDYYRIKSKDLGIGPDYTEVFSIHMASVTTDIYFTEKYMFNKQK